MGLSAKSTGGTKDEPEVGTYMGRLVGLVDLGHQPGFVFEGEEIDSKFKIRFTYELPSSKTVEGKPHWVSEDVNVSNYEGKGITSTMMKRVRALDPTLEISSGGKNLVDLVGSSCMIEVGHNKNGYSKIKNVTGMPAGMEVPALSNDPLVFNMESPDFEQWDRLPEFIKERITQALDYAESGLEDKVNSRANEASQVKGEY